MHDLISFMIIVGMLLATIGIHEYGHYRVAIHYRMPVTELSVGLGNRLFGWTSRHGVPITIRLLPLGGYVAFRPRRLQRFPAGQRILMTLAGPAMNLAAMAVYLGIAALLPWNYEANLPLWKYMLSMAADLPLQILNGVLDTFTPEFWGNAFSSGNLSKSNGGMAGQAFPMGSVETVVGGILLLLFIFNGIVAFFNLLPIPPLDGGKVLTTGMESILPRTVAIPLGRLLTAMGGAYLLVLVGGLILADMWRFIVRIFA